jgi:D-sedoheptulose 7-phosphate isomerase
VSYSQKHLSEAIEIIQKLDVSAIENVATLLAGIKAAGGRVFFLGVGGSAGNCSHAVNDFRKIVGIECYAPTDNVSELTARANDDGWASIFVEWLKVSRLSAKDALYIMSVGGGNLEKNISPNLVEAIKYAKTIGAKVTGVVGRDGGYTAKSADACVIVHCPYSESRHRHSSFGGFSGCGMAFISVASIAEEQRNKMGIRNAVMRPAVFLDRDGVINRSIVRDNKPYPPDSMAELEILPGVTQALESLRAAGYLLVVVTNQPDVGRGTARKQQIEAMNEWLVAELPLTGVYTCFHAADGQCDCRKPKPGLLLQAARELDIDLAASYMVGDRWRDVEAGQQAGCKTFYVDYGYAERQPQSFDYRVKSLLGAAQLILQTGIHNEIDR